MSSSCCIQMDRSCFLAFKDSLFNLANSGVLRITPLCQRGCQDPRYTQLIGIAILYISQFAVRPMRIASANAFLDAPHVHPIPKKTRFSSFSHRSPRCGEYRLPFTELRVDESRQLYRFHGGNSPRHHGRSL